MILAAILIFGILTLWAPRWALSAFEIALFAYAIVVLVRRRVSWHPVALLLALAAAWGVMQIAAHQTIYEWRTWDAVLNWTANLAAFLAAFELGAAQREKFLRVILIFAAILSIAASFTALASPPGKIFWLFDAGTNLPTLGPFVYRNQYAAFIEAVLPLAIVRALLDRGRWLMYTLIAATMFASVIAGGSRAGSILCLAEILITPVIAFAQKRMGGRSLTRVLAGSVAAVVLLTAIVGWEAIWKRFEEPNPYSLRAELARSSIEMVRDRPLAGFGLGAWSDAYPAYAHFDDGNFVNQAHNDWVQWAAEGGIPFFLILLAIAICMMPPAVRSLWGIGIIAVFAHCAVDYPMQQRPALAAFFFAMMGAIASAGTLFKQGRVFKNHSF
ncbi:MAG TPA: O-antigen ligase family protein, partial [Bryobacteraceae bacterium]|nr:O-antigen ligase family protein [Bryobacteraceae bacterium]